MRTDRDRDYLDEVSDEGQTVLIGGDVVQQDHQILIVESLL
jgi:hypothetical protein